MNINERLEAVRADASALLADVRTPEEYALGHIPGSVNWPLEALAMQDIPEGRAIYTYCHSGSRSARAAARLLALGYPAENIGGIVDYAGELETR